MSNAEIKRPIAATSTRGTKTRVHIPFVAAPEVVPLLSEFRELSLMTTSTCSVDASVDSASWSGVACAFRESVVIVVVVVVVDKDVSLERGERAEVSNCVTRRRRRGPKTPLVARRDLHPLRQTEASRRVHNTSPCHQYHSVQELSHAWTYVSTIRSSICVGEIQNNNVRSAHCLVHVSGQIIEERIERTRRRRNE